MSEAHAGTLPALTDNRYLRFAVFAILYAAQGLPWGLFIVAVPAWAAGQGYSAAEVGAFVAIAALPWSLKLVAGPLMDRYTFLSMGRRRPWVLSAQLGIVVGLLMLSLAPNPADNLMLIAWLGFFINAFCALQDVAVDGMAIDVLPVDERARANAFMYGGQLVGISSAGSGGTWLLTNFGIDAAALALCLAVVAIMAIAISFRERPGERILPWSAGEPAPGSAAKQAEDIRRVFKDLIRVVFLPMSLLLVFVEFLNRASAGVFVAIGPIITVQQVGWADTLYANWQATAGVAAAIFGVAVSPLIDRFGAGRALLIVIALRVVLFGIVALFPEWWSTGGFFQTVIIIVNMSGQVVTIAFMALFMAICAPRVAATQFAVYMASANLALSAGSGLVAAVDPYLDAAGIVMLAAGMNALFLLAWPLFDLERHERRIEQLGLAT